MSEFESLEKKINEMNVYARRGDIKTLYADIQNDSFILKKIDNIPFAHTPLHEAAVHGQTDFAIEILGLLPSLGRKLDPDGFSPLHIALKEGHNEMAHCLVKFDKELVRVRGFEGLTPLHYAAKNCPRPDVLACFLINCQLSINDRTNRFESAIHLVMESGDHKAMDLMLKWLVRTSRESILELKDEKGNTALHVAARHAACKEAVKFMANITKLNKRNHLNQTPLDVAIQSDNEEVVKLLKKARAKKGQELSPKETGVDYLGSKINLLEKAVRSYTFLLKDLTVEMRGVVLVVAVLIATATYQAVLQPPGGVYPPSDDDSGQTPAIPSTPLRIGGRRSLAAPPVEAPAPEPPAMAKAGKMVMDAELYHQFMPANTLAFTMSMVMIIFVLHGRPYNAILHTCLIFLAYSYLVAMEAISEEGGLSRLMFVLSWSVLSTTFAFKMLYYLVKALFEDVWWLPRCGVTWHNWSYQEGRGFCRSCILLARKLRRQSKLIQRLET